MEIREGRTRILSPKDVFYNPHMELCRDIDVACVSAFCSFFNMRSLKCVDALAATGVRGIRIACEVFTERSDDSCDCHLVLNDRSKRAYETICENIQLNKIDNMATASNEDANVLLHRLRFDIVDLDPFGSPVPFLNAACRSVRRLLLVTATDTAPLCGAHSGGFLKYDAFPLRTEYHREMATRILLGKVFRELLKYRKLAVPLICYARRHFVRLVLHVSRIGAKLAEKHAMHELGFIAHCTSCGNRFSITLSSFVESHHSVSSHHSSEALVPKCDPKCDICGESMKIGGPLFLGDVKHRDFCEHVLREILRRKELKNRKSASKIVERCRDEIEIPYYYEVHALCRSLNISPPPLSAVISSLQNSGFRASRTHFSDTAFKTDANIREIKNILSDFAHG